MKWSSAVSESSSLAEAVAECASVIRDELGDKTPDLIVAFVSAHHSAEYESVPKLVRAHLSGGTLIGCSTGGVIGAGREVENRAGFSMAAAHLPDVNLTPFHVEDAALPDGDAAPDEWHALFGTSANDAPQFLLLADPFSVRGEHLLMGLDYAYPQSVKIGGLASGGNRPGTNALYLSDDVHHAGVVGIALTGDIVVDTVVAQGCKPIGQPMHITKCDQNALLELDGHTPFEALKEIFAGLSSRDQELAQH
ncbi:MAG: hypothetical protein IIC84_07450, partial [Chloroflexi bacterium]|nr:hypothetical protein [Chloroflexota bacterium]